MSIFIILMAPGILINVQTSEGNTSKVQNILCSMQIGCSNPGVRKGFISAASPFSTITFLQGI